MKHARHFDKAIPNHLKVLWGIIVILLVVVGGRTYLYTHKQVVTQAVNVRSGPGIEYKKITSLQPNARVAVIRSKYHWKQVRTPDHKTGWIADWYFSQPNPVTKLSQATIVIDAGHGGSDSGALSISGKQEKKYTLIFAQKLADKLEAQGAKVYMTRKNDSFVGLAARPALAERVHADAFISFHFDSSPDENQGSGFTTYYYHQGASYRLAKDINSSLNPHGLDNKGVEFGDYLVIRDNTVPAVLNELGYINTKKDFKKIRSTTYQDQVTTEMTTGIAKFFEQE
ncbi:N-acetylmuramoyl-L-alanine amidase [Ligilactobacillus saerimneri]|uniref:N-acetylmuramoyl-L-alanine amidase n=1 Tax=Ligilactobacillus saerimneri TaxID=228229 RepID=UPI001C10A332|nr:N-acetylmuramoyl-L-alanine amidase [Ligilactobacillus saerimneri]MBU5309174.1 N-acetylmuramoyl-L-alanine amidase [Ligilactobacillus saerimneri]MDI9205804.1 N-acetylmuramoyl-L-alanine amidase [Ligilactobacillus saerimneri]